jgi:O-methyltransferase
MYRLLVFAVDFIRAVFRFLGVSITLAPLPRGIPDADLYDPRFQPWRSQAWRNRLRQSDARSLVSLDRKYVLDRLLSIAVRRTPGDVAECGVYKGGTAYLFAEHVQSGEKHLCLFDTFDGMPKTNPSNDLHKEGDFGDTSLEEVQAYLAAFDKVEFFPGPIPTTLAAVSGRTFCFVHVDLDIYDAILSATEFFYPRVPPGGFLVYDDYGAGDCPGARKAVDEFYARKPEVPLVLHTGQCIVMKL